MDLNESILSYIQAHGEEARKLLIDLAQIPAPSGQEERRVAFCQAWLRRKGAAELSVDEAKNLICSFGDTGDNELMVFLAHSDVVFPDTTPLPLRLEDGRIYCPGVGDDTANVAALLTVAGYLLEHRPVPKNCGVLLVVNACEEGLGNLRGCRKLMQTYGSRVKEFITFDGGANSIVTKAVGSKRYQVTVQTQGGHSYGCFGRPNAIAHLAKLIHRLYQMEVPPLGKTTYNVGTISGGTSVNTIAQDARMLFEFRSDEAEALDIMEAQFRQALADVAQEGVEVSCELVGFRPCGCGVEESVQQAMVQRASRAVQEAFGFVPACSAGSTDCNVPLSMGIPAICPGCVMGSGAHTREEFVELSSLIPGLRVAFSLILHHFEGACP